MTEFAEKQASTERLSYRLKVAQQVSTDQAGVTAKQLLPLPCTLQQGRCVHLGALSSVRHPTTPKMGAICQIWEDL